MNFFKRIWNWLCSLFGGGKKREQREFEQSVRQMQEALGNMKAQTEAVLAAQEKRRREMAQCDEQIAKMERYAAKASKEGRDSEARFFMEKKEALARQLAALRQQAQAAERYTSQAESLYRSAQSRLGDITARHDSVKAKLAAAELAESMNRLQEGGAGEALAKQEAEAQAALDKAEALAELEGRTGQQELESLMKKYDSEDVGAGRETSAEPKPGMQ